MDLGLQVSSWLKRRKEGMEEKLVKPDEMVAKEQLAGRGQAPFPAREFTIYKMDSPGEAPFRLEAPFKIYREMMIYMFNKRLVHSPDLWIRHTGKHQLTKNGYQWTHVGGPEPIESFVLDVVDIRNRGDYIVALVHEKATGEELPVPLDLARFGDNSCCEPPCGDLEYHLKRIWPDRVVVEARRFSSDGNDVLEMPLDNRFYDNCTNDLYLSWVPAPIVEV